jgi:hypothetical protein
MAGNANSGRRNDRSITDALRSALKQNDHKELTSVVNVWIARAKSGDMTALLGIVDRLEGKPVQQIDSNSTIEHRYVRAPKKATEDEWKQYLNSKTNGASGKPNGARNSH